MASLNYCTFIGNLGKDPEIRYAPGGEAMTKITLACNEEWKDKTSGEKKSNTEWVNVTFFGKLAEVANQYLKKGSLVFVAGSLKTRKYADKDGVEKYATEIKGAVMQMLGSASDERPQGARQANAPAPSSQPQQKAPQRTRAPVSMEDDDIPF